MTRWPENPVEYALGITGWMRDVELAWLSRIAAALPSGAVWLEVGTWMGKSWSCVALSLPDKSTLISVDTFDGGNAEPLKYVQQYGPPLPEFFRTLQDVHRQRPALLTQVAIMPSVEAAELMPDASCDVIFIDGDHRTFAVLADIKAWMPKVKRGGLLCGHDADDPTVLAALAGLPLERMDPSDRGSIWCRRR